MSVSRLLASLSAIVVAGVFGFTVTANAAVQSKDDQKCTNTVHKNGAKSSKIVNKDAQKCLKNFAKGKAFDSANPAIDTLEECLVNDAKGKRQKQKDKSDDAFGKFCSPVPEFGVTDSFVVNAAASTREGDLVHDVFGPDLDAGQIVANGDIGDAADAAKCQQKVLKTVSKCLQTREKEFLKCAKSGLKDGTIDDIGDLASCYDGTDPAKIQKKCAGIPGQGMQKDVQKCDATVDDRTLSAMFPGCGVDDVASVTTCLDDAARCRFCQAANAATGASRDCDLFDDAAANGSCADADGCEPLNALHCLLPYPSSNFLEASATATGLQVNIPDEALPTVTPPLVAAPFNELDGFNPMGAAIMHFPQGVDPELSNAARLLEPGCCGQPAGPPWIDTRAATDRSLDPNSPSILINATTGEHILHFIEPDGRSEGDVSQQVLFLRPGVSLEAGTRYIVAMRNLKAPNSDDVVAEAPFAALRDGTGTTNVAVEGRRAYYEANIFPQLIAANVPRENLVLAYDFTTQSEKQLTRQMLAMRDQGLAYADAIHADPNEVNFTATIVTENDCNDPGEVIWRHVNGTFEAPLFLTAVPTLAGGNVPQHSVDPNDIPVQNGTMDANYDITIPCSVHDPNSPTRPIVMGHGIFGTAASMVLGVPPGIATEGPWTYIAGGTEWLGLSNGGAGQIWVANSIVGLGASQLNNFAAFPDRLRQGMSNQLVLGRMMKLGTFNRDPAFQLSSVGVFPGAGEEMFYHGISLGGIMGTYFSGLTPDVERFSVDVPAANFGCLLQRSTQFSLFEALLPPIGLDAGLEQALGTGALIHELWVSAEPASLVRHITSDPLPGSGGPSKLLLTVGWLDKQVSNTCTEILARTLGIPNVQSVQQGLVGIPDSAGPEDSALVIYDTGFFDLFNPAHQVNIPALSNKIPTGVCDPHNGPRSTPAARQQILNFLQPGGVVTNFCTGACDAVDVVESPSFVCDPNNP